MTSSPDASSLDELGYASGSSGMHPQFTRPARSLTAEEDAVFIRGWLRGLDEFLKQLIQSEPIEPITNSE